MKTTDYFGNVEKPRFGMIVSWSWDNATADVSKEQVPYIKKSDLKISLN